jgi:hypothetical protein
MIPAAYIENLKSNYDGKWVGDARNRFADKDGKITYVQSGKDIKGQSFERVLGDVGFLLELTPQEGRGAKRLEFRDSPARTQDWEDVLYGMIEGRTNVEALGVARVTKVSSNGRGQVITLWGAALDAALDDLGYPDICRKEFTVENGFGPG